MLQTSSDKWFWQDSSPDWQEYLNTPWSNLDAPVMESMREMIEAFKPATRMFDSIVKKPIRTIEHHKSPHNPIGPAYHYVVDEAGVYQYSCREGGLIPHIQTIFTGPQNEIEGPSGPDTHDDRGRPRLDSSGGVARPVQPFHRCPHGQIVIRCRRCRR